MSCSVKICQFFKDCAKYIRHNVLLFPCLSVGATTVVPVVPGAAVVGITVPVVAHALSLLSPPFIQANSFANF